MRLREPNIRIKDCQLDAEKTNEFFSSVGKDMNKKF